MNIPMKKTITKMLLSHMCQYIFLAILFSAICQIITDRVLIQYELFWAVNYQDLLINLFTAQVTIIILPLSLFGIFTETTNEVYLGQPVAKYMYTYKYGNFFVFSYKELIVSSMILTLVEYIFMAKGLLAAELWILAINTTVMIVSLFSWIDVRIRKEKLYTFIRKQLSKEMQACMKEGEEDPYDKRKALEKLLSDLKNWVVNGGDYELDEAMEFYGTLCMDINFWNMLFRDLNEEKEGSAKRGQLSYESIDDYFNELVAALMRKEDYYRALRCSKSMMEVVAMERTEIYYCPKHYHYRVLLNLFRTMTEMQMDLLGDQWLPDYLIAISRNGNERGIFQTESRRKEEEDSWKLEEVIKEGCTLVYDILMAVWENHNLGEEYKRQFLRRFLFAGAVYSNIKNSLLYICMKLIHTNEQKLIHTVIEEIWDTFGFACQRESYAGKEDADFWEKSMILILAYCYYLAVYQDRRDITVPELSYSNPSRESDPMEGYYVGEALTDSMWKWHHELTDFFIQYGKEEDDFWLSSRKVIGDMMLYGSMSNGQWTSSARNDAKGRSQVIGHFRNITGDEGMFKEAMDRYKKYIRLFGTKDTADEQIIGDGFYEFKKEILQYYMEPLQDIARNFKKEQFWEELKEKIWKEILAERPIRVCSLDGEDTNTETREDVVVKRMYLIAPYKEEFEACKMKAWLCKRLLERQKAEGKMYHVISLEWEDQELSDAMTERLIEKGQEFKVPIYIQPVDINNIMAMNFRTHKEAYEFIKSAYREIVFRMKVEWE